MPDIKPFPKPDLSFYHDIPEGACLNYNNRYDYYQVYRSIQVEDPVSGERRQSRITYGSIRRDGTFVMSPTWRLMKERDAFRERAEENGKKETAPVVESQTAGTGLKQADAFRLEMLLSCVILSSLGGKTDAAEISTAANGSLREAAFSGQFRDLVPQGEVSPVLIRKAMMLARPGKLPDLCLMLSPVFAKAGTGRHPAVRNAVSIQESSLTPGRVLLWENDDERDFFDAVSDPGIIRLLDLRGCVLAVPLRRAPIGLEREALSQGGDYLFVLSDRRFQLEEETKRLFVTHGEETVSSVIHADTGDVKKKKVTVSLLPASLLPPFVTAYYDGLEGGSIVRIDMSGIRGTRKVTSAWCITSMAPVMGNLARIAETAVPCLLPAEELHWLVVLRLGDERMRPDDPVYLANRQALSVTAESLLRYWSLVRWEECLEDEPLSISEAMELAQMPVKALRCLSTLHCHSLS